MTPSDDAIDDSGRPVKAALKREAEALRALGRRLVALNPDQQARLPLDEALRDALTEYRRMPTREAQRRQIQRIGKLLRDLDADAITAAVDRFDPASPRARAAEQRATHWRDRLLDVADDTALTDFIEAHPAVDRQRLRVLTRRALKGRQEARDRAALELLRFIRAHTRAAPG